MKGKTRELLLENERFHTTVLDACAAFIDELGGMGIETSVINTLKGAEVLVTISSTYYDGPIAIGLVEFHSQQGLTLEQMVEAIHIAVQKKLS